MQALQPLGQQLGGVGGDGANISAFDVGEVGLSHLLTRRESLLCFRDDT